MSATTDLVARLPYVTRLDATQDCDGYRWSHMPLKALADMDIMARWQFRALPQPDQAANGTYCWHHLFSLGLWSNPAEEDRYRKALARLRAEQEISRNNSRLHPAEDRRS